jgi:hypothetical protein
MLDSLTTPTEDGDVTSNQTQPENTPAEENNPPDVEGQETETPEPGSETTEESDYDKAWETLDIDNPDESIFGETTLEPEPEVPGENPPEEPGEGELNVEPKSGLVITNPVLKYKGREIPIDSEEEMISLAQKGFKLENEMTKIKPLKPFIKLVDEGLTLEVAKAAVDLMNGNQGALAYLKQAAGIEDSGADDSFFGLDEGESKGKKDYKPETPSTDPVAEFFSSYSEENPSVAGKVTEVYADIPDEFKQEVYNPSVFPAFVNSIEIGEFEKVYPYAMKMRTMNPALTWMQAYVMAGKKIAEGTMEDQTKAKEPPKSVEQPKGENTQKRDINKLNYDAAFDMDLSDLEDKLFS